MTGRQTFVERQLARLHLLVLLPVFGVLILALFWTVIYFRLVDERAVAREEATSHAEALSRQYADQSARVLRQIDQTTRFIKFAFEQQPRDFNLSRFVQRKGILPTEQILRITISDAHGDGTAGVHTADMTNVADRAYFKAHVLAETDPLFISQPLLEPYSTDWSIVVSRRLNRPDGGFAGIVAIALRQDMLTDFAPSGIGPNAFVGLVGSDGVLRAGRLGATRFKGEERRFTAWTEPMLTRRAIRFITDSAVDPVNRIVSVVELEQFPLKAVIGIDQGQAWAGYYRHRSVTIWWGIAGSFGISAFIALLMLQSAHLRKSQRARAQAQSEIRAAVEGSLDALTILHAVRDSTGDVSDFVITELNDRAAHLMGQPSSALRGGALLHLAPDLRGSEMFDRYVQVLKTGIPLQNEFEVDQHGGVWLHQQVVAVTDGVAITTRDISASKAAEFDIRSKRAFLQSLIDNLPLAIYARDMRSTTGKMVVWNKTAEIITGYAAEQVLNQNSAEVFPDWMQAIFDEFETRMRRNPVLLDMPEVAFQSRSGVLHYLRIISVPLLDDAGRLEHLLGIAEDISGSRRQALELRSKQAELIAANDASPLGMFRANPEGICTYVNRTYERISGQRSDVAMGDGWINAIHREDRFKVLQTWRQASGHQSGFQATYRFCHADGKVVWVAMKAAPILVDGQVEGYVGSVDDITARREAEQSLAKSEQRLRTITDTLPALVAFIDAEQRFRFNNLAYERLYGVNRDSLKLQTISEFVGPEQYALIAPWLARALQGETVTFEQEEAGTDGKRWSEATYIPQLADDGNEVVGVHIMIHDITANKREEQRLLQLAQVDSLTGLINRAGFEQTLASAMNRSRASKRPMALMYLDIDHFKRVNDTHGHLIGDALLKAFAGRLSRTVRKIDTVTRLGGDEFTVIMEGIPTPTEALPVAEKIVASMRSVFTLDGLRVSISTSIGVAFFDGTDLESTELIRRADAMLYQAKANGRNQFCVWQSTPPTPTAAAAL